MGIKEPKTECAMYAESKGQCSALRELVCTHRECPFFKTKQEALDGRLKSARRRLKKDFPLSTADQGLLIASGDLVKERR